MATKPKDPVSVSKNAFKDWQLILRAIKASGSEWVAFPETDTKFASITELMRKKNLLKKKGERTNALYAINIDPSLVAESSRASKGTGTGQGPKTQSPAVVKSPVSRGGYLPNYYTLKAFVQKAEEESKLLGQAKSDELERRIDEMAVSLSKTKNAAERSLLIQELSKADEQRKNLGASIIIEAIKNTASAKEFKQYDFDASIVSIDPADYLNQ